MVADMGNEQAARLLEQAIQVQEVLGSDPSAGSGQASAKRCDLLLAWFVSPRTFMEILGHSQISPTMNTCTHILPAMKQEAAQVMDGFLG